MTKGKLFILSAPSGAGKTTVVKKVMENIPGLAFSVSHTTRKPRKGEKNGVDYYFVDKEKFLAMKDQGLFLENAEVHGNFYGTSRDGVNEQQNSGYDVILDIDVQGADIIRKYQDIGAVYIFLAPPSINELENRLRARGQDDDETIAKRLENARTEMEAMDRYEYIVINDQVEDAVKMFEAVILAERSKARRNLNGTLLK